jgi:hypothetical protein
LSTGSVDGYLFDSKIEVVQEFCFQILAWETVLRVWVRRRRFWARLVRFGLPVASLDSPGANAEKPAGMAGFLFLDPISSVYQVGI